MDWLPVLTLAAALSADAFAVAVAHGAVGQSGWRHALTAGVAFGLAQGLMPVLGLLLGSLLGTWIEALDHWIALFVLSGLGLMMLRQAGQSDTPSSAVRLGAWALFVAAVSTSIDALAAGITLPVFAMPPLLACLIIGMVTALLSMLGVRIGGVVGAVLGRRAEFLGGMVLILLGMKIFYEHQFGAG